MKLIKWIAAVQMNAFKLNVWKTKWIIIEKYPCNVYNQGVRMYLA